MGLILFLVVLFDAGLQARSAETDVLPGIKEVLDRGKLVVAAIKRDFPPIVFTDEKGELAGFDVDLARAIARELGVEVEFDRRAESDEEVIDLVAGDKADIGVSFLTRTSARAKRVLFTDPYAKSNFVLLINRRAHVKLGGHCPTIRKLHEATGEGVEFGIVRNALLVERVREFDSDLQPRQFDSPTELFDAVLSGQVSVALMSELLARLFFKTHPEANIRLNLCEEPTRWARIAIAVRPGLNDLRLWLNVFLEDREIEYDASDLAAAPQPTLDALEK